MFNPTICTIGDGYNDTLMMQESDISFELRNKWEKKSLDIKGELVRDLVNASVINSGDILVENLWQIQKIIIESGL